MISMDGPVERCLLNGMMIGTKHEIPGTASGRRPFHKTVPTLQKGIEKKIKKICVSSFFHGNSCKTWRRDRQQLGAWTDEAATTRSSGLKSQN